MNEDYLKPLKSQIWNNWMSEPIPCLNGMTPVQASKTFEGRMLVDQLLDFCDSTTESSRGGEGGNIDANIPSDYARWKLGYGPGSKTEFAEEEIIFNHLASPENTNRSTQRKERHTNKLEKKKASIFIPERCEVEGCTKRGEDVKSCSRCQCIYYCGKHHQQQDWSRHKVECKALSKFDFELQPKPFTPSEEIKKYPLGCFPISKSEAGSKCFICHSTSSEVDITYTQCCNLPVCDNSHEYQIMSYSRDFCYRSHTMYTACSSHYEENHSGDWRECPECNCMSEGARSFSSTNRFCATPCLEKFLPQGSMLTYPCNTSECKARMLPGHSGGTQSGGKNFCTKCKPVN